MSEIMARKKMLKEQNIAAAQAKTAARKLAKEARAASLANGEASALGQQPNQQGPQRFLPREWLAAGGESDSEGTPVSILTWNVRQIEICLSALPPPAYV
jgi:hypothetical protein